MFTITETTPSVRNSSVFAEHRLSSISGSSFLSGMTPISNITIQTNDQTNILRSENSTRSNITNALQNHKHRSIGSSVADVSGKPTPTSPRLTPKPISKFTISVSSPGTSTLKKKLSGSLINNDSYPSSIETSSSSIHSGRKTSLSLNLFKQALNEHGPSFNVEENPTSTSPNEILSETSTQSSLSIVTDYFNSVQISPQNPYKIQIEKPDHYNHYNNSNDISDTEDFLEDDDDDDVTNDDEINSFLNDPTSPSLRLTPFANQVGGHTSFFRFSKKAVCKPLAHREHQFYEILEKLHPDLLPFVPQYLGVLNVTYRSHNNELMSMPEVVFEQNKHLLPEWILNSLDKNIGDDHNSDKENYDKGSSDDVSSQGLYSSITKVNKQLKEEVLCEVFSPKALRARMRLMLRNLVKSERLRTHCLHNTSVASYGSFYLQCRLLFSSKTQQICLPKSRASNAILNSLHRYSNSSRKFASVNSGKATERSSKFGRKAIIASSLVIGAAIAFLDKRTEAEAKVHEIEEFPSTLERGGPKNLPIATHLVDERDSDINKPRLVILGSGWGAISIIKELEKDHYHVTVISPQNYFLFTPLLPSATVGTLETRSLLEPIRSIIKGISAHFLEAKVTDICFNDKLVEVNPIDGSSKPFYVPYDKLIVAVGSSSITHGIEGIEHCHFLKTINDARGLRKKIMDNFEKASLPVTSQKERKRLLSFVICGGGPTGVEFAAELYDFLTEDVVKYFPSILRNEVQVSIIQGQDHILNTYDAKISDFAEKKFKRDNINVITNARVQKVEPDHIIYKLKRNEEVKELDYGLVLWSTGIAMNPLTKTISEKLEDQKNTRALITDNRLRLKGVSDSSVYAIGDCSTIENPKLVQQLMQFFVDADKDKSGSLSYDEFSALARKIGRHYPITKSHLKKASTLFARYDQDKSGTLELEELHAMLKDIDKNLTSLPATAQVAHQQGKYLGKKLNKIAVSQKTKVLPQSSDYSVDTDNSEPDIDNLLPPFSYAHFGSLAYVGNAAVADFGTGWTWMGGLPAVYLWRSVYFSEQVSFRTRALLALDWSKRFLFGRDISKF